MTKRYLVTVGIFGFLVMFFGAIGDHVLKLKLTGDNYETYQTGLQYMMYHTLALLALSFGHKMFSQKLLNVVYAFFFLGIFFFSFGMMIKATSSYTSLHLGFFSFIVPMGGMLFVAGWLYLIYMGLSFKHTKKHHSSRSHRHHSSSSSGSRRSSSED